MNTENFQLKDLKVGFICALWALPFVFGLSALAIESEVLMKIFSNSEWFLFKAVFGVLEIVIFGLGATISRIKTKIQKKSVSI